MRMCAAHNLLLTMHFFLSALFVLLFHASGADFAKTVRSASPSAASVTERLARLAALRAVNHQKRLVDASSPNRVQLRGTISQDTRYLQLRNAFFRAKTPPSQSSTTRSALKTPKHYSRSSKKTSFTPFLRRWRSGGVQKSQVREISVHGPSKAILDRTRKNRLPSSPKIHVSFYMRLSNLHARSRSVRSTWASHVSLPTSSKEGLTLDPCALDSDCKSPRTCINNFDDQGEELPCSPADANCFCISPSFPVECASASDCSPGEVCATIEGFEAFPTCISGQAVENIEEIEEVENTSDAPLTPTETPVASANETGPTAGGLTGDPCQIESDCVPDRLCVSTDGDLESCNPSIDSCLCIPPEFQTCTASADCVPGEICVVLDQDLDTVCVSETLAVGAALTEVGPSNSTVASPSPSPLFVSGGLTGDPCRFDNECIAERLCLGPEAESCQTSDLTCLCFPLVIQVCSSSADCVPGEVCVSIDTVSDQFCLSEVVVDNSDEINEVDPESKDDPEDSLVEPSPALVGGLTGDPCLTDLDCVGDRTCPDTGDCSEFGNCICVPPSLTECTSSLDCVAGEVCAFFTDDEDVFFFCVSAQLEEELDTLTEVAPDGLPAGTGFTGDPCTASFDCQEQRSCLVRESGLSCTSGNICICVPPEVVLCETVSDCGVGEVCASPVGSVSKEGICLSQQVVDDVDELDELVRVAHELLGTVRYRSHNVGS